MNDIPSMGSTVRKGGGLFLALGLLVLLCGVISMAAPLITGIALTLIVGVLLLLSGLFQLFHGLQFNERRARLWPVLAGILTVAVGIFVLSKPMSALAGLTLILAAFFLTDGILTAISAIQARPAKEWGWLLLSAIITFLLGAVIWAQWPVSGAWAIGILIGIRIFMAGLTIIFMGSAVRFMGKELASAEERARLADGENAIDAEAEEIK